MASTSRGPVGERADLTLVSNRRRPKLQQSNLLGRRFLWTVVALVALGVVLRYLPVRSSKASTLRPTAGTATPTPADLRLSGVQISRPPGGGALYVDGLVTNAGSARITGATAEVQFHDAQGNLIASVQKPMVGIAHGGTDLIANEMARNPIKPNEMRFFRVAVEVEDVPPGWNHEIPELIVVDIKAR
ncbi:MAG: FxLYD domain-containing protein [Candidatus Korobacteraceae bacterium]